MADSRNCIEPVRKELGSQLFPNAMWKSVCFPEETWRWEFLWGSAKAHVGL